MLMVLIKVFLIEMAIISLLGIQLQLQLRNFIFILSQLNIPLVLIDNRFILDLLGSARISQCA